MKKIYNFPKKSELTTFILPMKISWLIFLRFPGWKWKICRDQSRLTFSSRGFAARFRARGYAARACASILACAPMWACSQASVKTASRTLNAWWRHDRNRQTLLVQVTVVSVVVRSFRRQKANKPKLLKHCRRQGSKTKIWSVVMFLKWRHSSPIFHYAVNFIGRRGRSGKFKAWFYGKKASELIFFSLNTLLDVIEIPKPQNPFDRMDI